MLTSSPKVRLIGEQAQSKIPRARGVLLNAALVRDLLSIPNFTHKIRSSDGSYMEVRAQEDGAHSIEIVAGLTETEPPKPQSKYYPAFYLGKFLISNIFGDWRVVLAKDIMNIGRCGLNDVIKDKQGKLQHRVINTGQSQSPSEYAYVTSIIVNNESNYKPILNQSGEQIRFASITLSSGNIVALKSLSDTEFEVYRLREAVKTETVDETRNGTIDHIAIKSATVTIDNTSVLRGIVADPFGSGFTVYYYQYVSPDGMRISETAYHISVSGSVTEIPQGECVYTAESSNPNPQERALIASVCSYNDMRDDITSETRDGELTQLDAGSRRETYRAYEVTGSTSSTVNTSHREEYSLTCVVNGENTEFFAYSSGSSGSSSSSTEAYKTSSLHKEWIAQFYFVTRQLPDGSFEYELRREYRSASLGVTVNPAWQSSSTRSSYVFMHTGSREITTSVSSSGSGPASVASEVEPYIPTEGKEPGLSRLSVGNPRPDCARYDGSGGIHRAEDYWTPALGEIEPTYPWDVIVVEERNESPVTLPSGETATFYCKNVVGYNSEGIAHSNFTIQRDDLHGVGVGAFSGEAVFQKYTGRTDTYDYNFNCSSASGSFTVNYSGQVFVPTKHFSIDMNTRLLSGYDLLIEAGRDPEDINIGCNNSYNGVRICTDENYIVIGTKGTPPTVTATSTNTLIPDLSKDANTPLPSKVDYWTNFYPVAKIGICRPEIYANGRTAYYATYTIDGDTAHFHTEGLRYYSLNAATMILSGSLHRLVVCTEPTEVSKSRIFLNDWDNDVKTMLTAFKSVLARSPGISESYLTYLSGEIDRIVSSEVWPSPMVVAMDVQEVKSFWNSLNA